MNRQLPVDDVTDHKPATDGEFSHVLRGVKWRNGPVSPITFLRTPGEMERASERAQQLIVADELNGYFRHLVNRKVKASCRLLVLALALFLFAVLSPTPQPWALVTLGAVLAGAFRRARQAGALGLARRSELRAVLQDVTPTAAAG